MVGEGEWYWNQLIQHMLFAVRESLHLSCILDNFLDVAMEAWEKQPSPFRSVVDYVKDLQSSINHVLPILKQNRQKAQTEQKLPTMEVPAWWSSLLLPSAMQILGLLAGAFHSNEDEVWTVYVTTTAAKLYLKLDDYPIRMLSVTGGKPGSSPP